MNNLDLYNLLKKIENGETDYIDLGNHRFYISAKDYNKDYLEENYVHKGKIKDKIIEIRDKRYKLESTDRILLRSYREKHYKTNGFEEIYNESEVNAQLLLEDYLSQVSILEKLLNKEE